MSYFNFSKTLPPTPSDPLVDEVDQLNDNWDHFESKLSPYLVGGTISDVEAGQEYFDTNFRYAVYTGSSGRVPDDIDAAWSAWTALPIVSPRVPRPSVTPRWRVNTLLRMVELCGGVYFDVSQNAWTAGSLITITDDVSGGIPSTYTPVGTDHINPCATALTAGTSVVSAGYAWIDKPVGNTYCRVRCQYLGGPGGGNFIQLDQVWWWY